MSNRDDRAPYRQPGPEPPAPPMPATLIRWIVVSSIGLVLLAVAGVKQNDELVRIVNSAPVVVVGPLYLIFGLIGFQRAVRRHRSFWATEKTLALAFYLTLGFSFYVFVGIALVLLGLFAGACLCSGRK